MTKGRLWSIYDNDEGVKIILFEDFSLHEIRKFEEKSRLRMSAGGRNFRIFESPIIQALLQGIHFFHFAVDLLLHVAEVFLELVHFVAELLFLLVEFFLPAVDAGSERQSEKESENEGFWVHGRFLVKIRITIYPQK